MNHEDDDNDNDNYEGNASDGEVNDDNDDGAPGGAAVPPEDKILRLVRLLAGIVRTN
jgi:hypothetical protein